MNTIASETAGPLIGTNTDAGGFLQPLLRDKWKGRHAVLIGAGGAARAILFALTSLGVPEITIMARDPAKGQALLDRAGVKGKVIGMTDALPAADLLVNSTSLGMVGQPALDLDLSPLPASATVYDIVYAPLETGLLKAARDRGLKTLDGLEMLIGQAAPSFEALFRRPPRQIDRRLGRREVDHHVAQRQVGLVAPVDAGGHDHVVARVQHLGHRPTHPAAIAGDAGVEDGAQAAFSFDPSAS